MLACLLFGSLVGCGGDPGGAAPRPCMATSGAELASSDAGAVTCDDAIDTPAASPPAATEPADVASRSLVELY